MRILRMAWQGVFGYLGRNLLAAFALALGLLAFVTVSSASMALQSVISQRELLANGPVTTSTVTFEPGESAETSARAVDMLRTRFGEDIGISRVVENSGLYLLNDDGLGAIEVAVSDPTLLEVLPLPVRGGSWLNEKSTLAPQVVLNQKANEQLDVRGDSTWSIRDETGRTWRGVVVGVVADGFDQARAFLAFDAAIGMGWRITPAITTKLLVTSPGVSTSAVQEYVAAAVRLEALPQPSSIQRSDTINRVATELSATQSVFLIVITLSLLGTVVSIANLGFAGLKERSLELRLRRALGTNRSTIFVVVLLESQIVAVFSWVLAVAVSWFVYPAVTGWLGIPPGVSLPPYPMTAAFIGLAVGSIASLLGSIAPALRASKTGLAEVMRT